MGNFSIPSNSPILCGHQLSILQVNSVCPTCTRAQLLQLSLTLCSPIDCSPLGSSVHGTLQARIREWVAMPSSRRYSKPRDQIHICFHFLNCRRTSLSTESPQFSSVAQLCQTLCDPTDCSTPNPEACSNSCPSSQ